MKRFKLNGTLCLLLFFIRFETVSTPTADFDFNEACLGEAIQFENLSTVSNGEVLWVVWDFGDGSSSTSFSPTHYYSHAGSFRVKLTVFDENYDFAIVEKQVQVFPVATLLFEFDKSVCAGEQVQFTNLSSGFDQLQWDFGDGTGSTQVSPSHAFSEPGVYEIVLTGEKGGCVTEVRQTISVAKPIRSEIEILGSCSDSVFSLKYSGSEAANIANYSWNLGDGSVSLLPEVSHKYPPGTYSVSVELTSVEGCISRKDTVISSKPSPSGNLQVGDHCLGTAASFEHDFDTPGTFHWAFGDGKTNRETSPDHVYSSDGNYRVELTVVNEYGCSSTFEDFVNVHPVPAAEFSVDDICITDRLEVSNPFKDEEGWVFEWSLDGEVTIEDPEPSYRFTTAGSKTISLTVSSDAGCLDSAKVGVLVHEDTQPGTIIGAGTYCFGEELMELELEGNHGQVLFWSRREDPNLPWMRMEITDSVFRDQPEMGTTDYRVSVKNGLCAARETDVRRIDVKNKNAIGSIMGADVLCETTDTLTYSLTSHQGEDLIWQIKKDQMDSFEILSTNEMEISFENPNASFTLRAISAGNGCAPDTAIDKSIQPGTQAYAGVITGPDTLCESNQTAELSLADYKGQILDWQISQDTLEGWLSTGKTTPAFRMDLMQGQTFIRAVIGNGVCGREFTRTHSLTVETEPIAGYLQGPDEVCSDEQVIQVHSEGRKGTILQWLVEGIDSLSITENSSRKAVLHNPGTSFRIAAKVGNGNHCDAYTTGFLSIRVNSTPAANFEVDTACAGDPLQIRNLSSSSSDETTQYEWRLNEELISVSAIPNIVLVEGKYDLSLRVLSAGGCSDEKTVTSIVTPSAQVDFQIEDVCLGDSVRIMGDPNPVIREYSWYLNNAEFSTKADPSIFIDSAGSYELSLAAINTFGCHAEVSRNFEVNDTVTFKWTIPDHCAGEELSPVISELSDPSASILWSLGDGNTYANPYLKYIFPEPDTYTVRTEATNKAGCVSTASQIVQVFPIPIADFEVPAKCQGDTLRKADFDYPSSFCSTWILNMDDTIFSLTDVEVIERSGLTPVRHYVENEFGCQASASKMLEVGTRPSLLISVEDGCVGDSLSFRNLTRSIEAATYRWFVSDSLLGSGQDLRYVFDSPGLRTVRLSVTTELGCQTETRDTVFIAPLPEPSFQVDDACLGEQTHFFSPAKTGETCSWLFPDGTSKQGTSVRKIFDLPGVYSAELRITNSMGCQAGMERSFKVFDLPIADFSAPETCVGDTLEIFNNSWFDGHIQSLWSVDRAIISTSFSLDSVFTSPGQHALALKIIDDNGCQDSIARKITLRPKPQLKLSTREISASKGRIVHLYADGAESYRWEPAKDLDNPFSASPQLRVLESGWYKVFGSSSGECVSVDSVRIDVLEDYDIRPFNLLTPDGDGINDYWILDNSDAYQTISVKVYDKSGRMVLYDPQYQNSWDGTFNGHLLPDGTYYYQVIADEEVTFSGTLTLLADR